MARHKQVTSAVLTPTGFDAALQADEISMQSNAALDAADDSPVGDIVVKITPSSAPAVDDPLAQVFVRETIGADEESVDAPANAAGNFNKDALLCTVLAIEATTAERTYIYRNVPLPVAAFKIGVKALVAMGAAPSVSILPHSIDIP